MASQDFISEKWHFILRFVAPAVLTFTLFLATIFLVHQPTLETVLEGQKKVDLQNLVEMAWHIVESHYSEAKENGVPETVAQREALLHMRKLRYGPAGQDYFWINNDENVMIMHPYRPDLEGVDMTNVKDRRDKYLIREFSHVAKTKGQGFVDYYWQLYDDQSIVARKVSFVKAFKPWNWVIGTGVYLFDVEQQAKTYLRNEMLYTGGILVFLLIISASMLSESYKNIKEIQKNRKSLADYLDQMTTYSFKLSETGDILWLNHKAAQALRLRRRDLINSPFHLLPWWRNEGTPPLLQDYLTDTDSFKKTQINTQIFVHDNVERHFSFSFYPVRDDDGNFAYWIVEGKDITPLIEIEMALKEERDNLEKNVEERTGELAETLQQLKTSQHALVQQEKMASVGVIAAGIAHEINNPLNYIMQNHEALTTYLDIFLKILHLRDDVLSDDKKAIDEALGSIKEILADDDVDFIVGDLTELLTENTEGLERVRTIVDDLKNFSYKQKDRQTHTNLNDLMQATLKILHNEIKYNYKLDVFLDDEIPPILINPDRLRQVFMNMIINALHAMGDSGTLTVRSEILDGKEIQLHISDTGPGIKEKDLPRIFDPFYTTKEPGKGTGLGLSISRQIVQENGGDVFVDSSEKGTTFTISFPISDT